MTDAHFARSYYRGGPRGGAYKPPSDRAIEAQETSARIAAEDGSRRLLRAYRDYYRRHHPAAREAP